MEKAYLIVKSVINKHTPIEELVKQIGQKIKSAQVKYKVAVNREIRHYPVLIDYHVFFLLKEKISYTTINIVFKEINLAKIVFEKFNHQVSFEIIYGDLVIIKPPSDR